MEDDSSTSDIMSAIYQALCKHGYADVTMEHIAAESEKSKSTFHYHYDSKHDLLLAFLDDLYESFVERLNEIEGDSPYERLRATIDTVLEPPEDGPNREFKTALLEIKAQSPYDETFRERLSVFDQTLHGHIAEILAAGVESEEFRTDLDVDETADFLVTVFNGAQTRSVAVGRSIDQTRRTLDRHIKSNILAADTNRKTIQ